jgi:hypothetical protein
VFDIQDNVAAEAEPQVFEPEVFDPEVFDPEVLQREPKATGEAVPDEERARPTSRRSIVRVAIALAIVTVWAIANFALPERGDSQIDPVTPALLEATAGDTPQPFFESAACDVYVVPMDRESQASAGVVSRSLSRRTSLETCTTSSLRLDVALIDFHRNQLNAGFLMSRLSTAFRSVWGMRASTVIGFTELDMFSPYRPDWGFVFGSGGIIDRPQGYGVISTARMGSGDDRIRRLETMALRYLGFYYFGLPQSSNPTTALYSTIRGLDDLDRMQPQFSVPPPTEAELRAARKLFIHGGGQGSART